MSRAGLVEGLALFAEMTAQPGITWGEPARLQLNLEAVLWKDGYIEEHESSVLFSLIHYFGVSFSVLRSFMVW